MKAFSPKGSHSVLAQFLLLALTWGSGFLFLKVGLEGFSPTQVVLGRMVAGSAALLAMAALTKSPLPRTAVVWGHFVVLAILLNVAPFLLFAWAELYVSSGLASIYNATTPLMTMMVAMVALRDERPNRIRLTGLLTGFAGVVVVLGPWSQHTGGSVAAQGACLLATFCYGMAFVYLRRFVYPLGLPALSVAAGQVSTGALIMLLATPLTATSTIHPSWRSLLSVAVLGIASTGLAYVWNTNVVTAWGATNASTVTYLTPLVGVTLGVVVLSETLSWNVPVGALIVIAGIAVGSIPA